MKNVILALLILISAAWLTDCSRNESVPPEQKRSEVGGYAPDFALKDVSGKEVRLSEYRGRVVLLEFWATWCPPCRATVPELIALQEKYGEEGLAVLGVSVDDGTDLPSKLSAFSSEHHMNYPILLSNETAEKMYNVKGIPTAYLIDRQGKILKSYTGYTENFQQNIASELGKLR